MRLEMPAAAGRTPEGGWWGGTARLSNVALPHFVRGTHETFSRAPYLSLGLGIKLDCVTWCVEAGECRTSAGDALFRRSWAGNWALLFRNAGYCRGYCHRWESPPALPRYSVPPGKSFRSSCQCSGAQMAPSPIQLSGFGPVRDAGAP